MRRTEQTITLKVKKLKGIIGGNYTVLPFEVKKADVTADLVDGVLKCGTLLSADGKIVTTATEAYGIVYTDVDFNDELGNSKIVSLFVQGTVNEDSVIFGSLAAADVKAALNKIVFTK